MAKEAYIFAGVNGAGKTTLYYNELESAKDFGLRINIDEIVSSFGDWKNRKDQIRAAKIALKIREKYIKEGKDFNQESTLCGNSILSLFQNLKDSQYCINLFYVGVKNPEIAKERVKIRVAKGGHSIDPSVIETRYYKSLKNLNTIAPLCNSIIVFDNTQTFEKILEKRDNFLNIFKEPQWIVGLLEKLEEMS
ncbi:ATPase [Helicobacter apodemus]|uniref:ATPase n=1 Tax=Helicobacter apodemus TaxID=135569 RepID=A0A4V6I6D3_9HELI|nr:zeta toxin family protein [Helicobacter apodemus]TLE13261.1 ATPase [Helicobacter apodemus]